MREKQLLWVKREAFRYLLSYNYLRSIPLYTTDDCMKVSRLSRLAPAMPGSPVVHLFGTVSVFPPRPDNLAGLGHQALPAGGKESCSCVISHTGEIVVKTGYKGRLWFNVQFPSLHLYAHRP